MTSPWTDEKIERLRELWLDGVSARLIGKALDVSKSAVVGKAHRLELPSRASPIQRWAISQAQAKADQAVRRGRGQTLLPWNITRAFLSVVGMKFSRCQFIAGHPSVNEACKCGRPTDGGPWCAEHHRRCTVKLQPKVAA